MKLIFPCFPCILLLFGPGITLSQPATGTNPDSICQAAFEARPDSLTSYPYLYHFKDLSTGNINSWEWDFGDGTFSGERNPSHLYDGPGKYNVSLKVSNQNDTIACSDATNMEITTLDYFSLGGLVYAGEYPLNNPAFSGDTGIASLYRFVNQQVVYVEDVIFQDYGYYWFGYLFPAEYLLKVGLTKGSTHFGEYFTTYFGNDIIWTKAAPISIDNDNLYENEIHLVPVQDLTYGNGRIQGYVNFEQGDFSSMPPVSKTSVILSDINRNPITFTTPNAEGYFEFTGIPVNSYSLTADATGKPATVSVVTLTEDMPEVEGINLTVFGSSTSYVPEEEIEQEMFARIYPNPVKDNLYLHLNSLTSSPCIISIKDLTGRQYHTTTRYLETGKNQLTIPVASLGSGFYLLEIQSGNTDNSTTVKFIK
jgi:PKD repeat protein